MTMRSDCFADGNALTLVESGELPRRDAFLNNLNWDLVERTLLFQPLEEEKSTIVVEWATCPVGAIHVEIRR